METPPKHSAKGALGSETPITAAVERRTLGQTLLHIVSNHGLFLLGLIFVIAYAILLPPVLVLVFVAIMVFESDYTHLLRAIFFAPTA